MLDKRIICLDKHVGCAKMSMLWSLDILNDDELLQAFVPKIKGGLPAELKWLQP